VAKIPEAFEVLFTALSCFHTQGLANIFSI